MVAADYVAEGYGMDGMDQVAMCAPFVGTDALVKVSDTTPFAAGCAPLNGTLYDVSYRGRAGDAAERGRRREDRRGDPQGDAASGAGMGGARAGDEDPGVTPASSDR